MIFSKRNFDGGLFRWDYESAIYNYGDIIATDLMVDVASWIIDSRACEHADFTLQMIVSVFEYRIY